jgi:beta-phosphoglucomutase
MATHNRSQSIAAVIFDLDGTIANTIDLHYQSWLQLTGEEGIEFDDRIHDNLLGRNREDALAYLLGNRTVSQEKRAELLERKNRYYLDSLTNFDRRYLLPGIWDLLHEIHDLGLKIALASSSKNAKIVLEKLEIIHLFDRIADGNSVAHPKPAPDIFLYAANSIGVAPEHCLAIEDAPAGVEAAIAANMWVVGVGTIDRVQTADLIFPSLAGIRWRDILSKLKVDRSNTG